MRLRPLIVLCLLTVGHCVSSSDNWCVDDDDDDHSDVYQSALDYLASSSINQSQLQQLIGDVFLRVGCYRLEMTSLTNMSCERCLSAENIYELLQLAADETLNRTTFHRSSTVIISFIYRLTNSCDVNNRRNWSQLSYDHFTDQLLTMTSVLEDEHHDHEHHDHGHEHEDSHEEREDNKDNDHDHDHEHHEDGEDDSHDEEHSDEDHDDDDKYLTTRQLEHMLRRIADSYQPGQSAALGSSSRKQQIDFICSFGDLKSFTSADVYRAVKPASPEHGIMSHELGKMSSILIMKLLSGECIQQVDENVPAPTEFVRSIYEIYASKRNCCRLSVEDIEQMTSKLGIQSKDDHDDHNDDHNDHDGHAHERRRRRRAISGQNPQSPHQRHLNNSACYSVEQLLRSFDIAESSGVSRTDFHRLCPAIVQQATSCQPPTTAQPTDTSQHSPSDAEVYGYGTASVFVITVISLCGLFVIRFRHTVAYNYLVNLMLGLAVGTLVGDAMLHLIPHALGLHQHNDEHGDHAHHTGEVVIEPFVWKTLCSTLTVWLFFVVQSILHWISRTIRLRRTSKQGVQKRVATADSERCETDDDGGVGVCSETENSQSQLSASDQELMHTHADPSAAWMVTVGDAVHNLADGMAIGVSYTAGWETGLSTSIAVFCHELPHEFGDVAIMVTNGWSTFKVAIFQLLSGATAFIGLYIGITITQYLVEAQEWIFIVAAAMFLYVALADVVPELFEHQAKYGYLPMLMMANVGILLGVIVMLALAIFENQFRIRV